MADIQIGDAVVVVFPRDLATNNQHLVVEKLPSSVKPWWEFTTLAGDKIVATIPFILKVLPP